MTADIFVELFSCSYFDITKANLIVVDEIHHARKNHSYSKIFQHLLAKAPSTRPRILGLTASPISSVGKEIFCVHACSDLCDLACLCIHSFSLSFALFASYVPVSLISAPSSCPYVVASSFLKQFS